MDLLKRNETFTQDENTNVQMITTLEIAEMMEISHRDILNKLQGTKDKDGNVKQVGIIPTLAEANFRLSDYFVESSYKDSSGKVNKCYNVTRLGCDFLANKFTGEKGIIFTAKYVKRFHEMEQELKPRVPQSYKEALLETVRLLEENEKLQEEKEQERIGREKAEQRNAVLMHVNRTYTMTEIAKELGLKSATELNKILADLHIQYKVNKTWVMYSDYSHLGYEDIKQDVLDNGTVVYHRKITQAGREFIVNLINNSRVANNV